MDNLDLNMEEQDDSMVMNQIADDVIESTEIEEPKLFEQEEIGIMEEVEVEEPVGISEASDLDIKPISYGVETFDHGGGILHSSFDPIVKGNQIDVALNQGYRGLDFSSFSNNPTERIGHSVEETNGNYFESAHAAANNGFFKGFKNLGINLGGEIALTALPTVGGKIGMGMVAGGLGLSATGVGAAAGIPTVIGGVALMGTSWLASTILTQKFREARGTENIETGFLGLDMSVARERAIDTVFGGIGAVGSLARGSMTLLSKSDKVAKIGKQVERLGNVWEYGSRSNKYTNRFITNSSTIFAENLLAEAVNNGVEFKDYLSWNTASRLAITGVFGHMKSVSRKGSFSDRSDDIADIDTRYDMKSNDIMGDGKNRSIKKDQVISKNMEQLADMEEKAILSKINKKEYSELLENPRAAAAHMEAFDGTYSLSKQITKDGALSDEIAGYINRGDNDGLRMKLISDSNIDYSKSAPVEKVKFITDLADPSSELRIHMANNYTTLNKKDLNKSFNKVYGGSKIDRIKEMYNVKENKNDMSLKNAYNNQNVRNLMPDSHSDLVPGLNGLIEVGSKIIDADGNFKLRVNEGLGAMSISDEKAVKLIQREALDALSIDSKISNGSMDLMLANRQQNPDQFMEDIYKIEEHLEYVSSNRTAGTSQEAVLKESEALFNRLLFMRAADRIATGNFSTKGIVIKDNALRDTIKRLFPESIVEGDNGALIFTNSAKYPGAITHSQIKTPIQSATADINDVIDNLIIPDSYSKLNTSPVAKGKANSIVRKSNFKYERGWSTDENKLKTELLFSSIFKSDVGENGSVVFKTDDNGDFIFKDKDMSKEDAELFGRAISGIKTTTHTLINNLYDIVEPLRSRTSRRTGKVYNYSTLRNAFNSQDKSFQKDLSSLLKYNDYKGKTHSEYYATLNREQKKTFLLKLHQDSNTEALRALKRNNIGADQKHMAEVGRDLDEDKHLKRSLSANVEGARKVARAGIRPEDTDMRAVKKTEELNVSIAHNTNRIGRNAVETLEDFTMAKYNINQQFGKANEPSKFDNMSLEDTWNAFEDSKIYIAGEMGVDAKRRSDITNKSNSKMKDDFNKIAGDKNQLLFSNVKSILSGIVNALESGGANYSELFIAKASSSVLRNSLDLGGNISIRVSKAVDSITKPLLDSLTKLHPSLNVLKKDMRIAANLKQAMLREGLKASPFSQWNVLNNIITGSTILKTHSLGTHGVNFLEGLNESVSQNPMVKTLTRQNIAKGALLDDSDMARVSLNQRDIAVLISDSNKGITPSQVADLSRYSNGDYMEGTNFIWGAMMDKQGLSKSDVRSSELSGIRSEAEWVDYLDFGSWMSKLLSGVDNNNLMKESYLQSMAKYDIALLKAKTGEADDILSRNLSNILAVNSKDTAERLDTIKGILYREQHSEMLAMSASTDRTTLEAFELGSNSIFGDVRGFLNFFDESLSSSLEIAQKATQGGGKNLSPGAKLGYGVSKFAITNAKIFSGWLSMKKNLFNARIQLKEEIDANIHKGIGLNGERLNTYADKMRAQSEMNGRFLAATAGSALTLGAQSSITLLPVASVFFAGNLMSAAFTMGDDPNFDSRHPISSMLHIAQNRQEDFSKLLGNTSLITISEYIASGGTYDEINQVSISGKTGASVADIVFMNLGMVKDQLKLIDIITNATGITAKDGYPDRTYSENALRKGIKRIEDIVKRVKGDKDFYTGDNASAMEKLSEVIYTTSHIIGSLGFGGFYDSITQASARIHGNERVSRDNSFLEVLFDDLHNEKYNVAMSSATKAYYYQNQYQLYVDALKRLFAGTSHDMDNDLDKRIRENRTSIQYNIEEKLFGGG